MHHRRSPILEKLAELYAASQLGQTGLGERPFSVAFRLLLEKAGCTSGDKYANALLDLDSADGVSLQLKKHRRSHDIQRVIVPLAMESALFTRVQRTSPMAERAAWGAVLEEAADWPVPEQYGAPWRSFCAGTRGADAAR